MKRSFSREFKLQLVRQLVSGEKRFVQLCREHNVCESLLWYWKQQYDKEGEGAWLPDDHKERAVADTQARITALEAALGRATLENEFLRQALQKRGTPSPRGSQ